MAEFFSITLTLFLVIDALGNIPDYLSLLKCCDKKKQKKIALRELLFALGLMLIFHFFGQWFIRFLNITPGTVKVSGAIILFLISIRLIFSDEEKTKWKEQEPFIVPIATPIIAGPTVLAAILIFANDEYPDLIIYSAIIVAWALSSVIYFFAGPIYKLVKEKGLNAAQRLMGLIVAMIAVQMFIEGMEGLFK